MLNGQGAGSAVVGQGLQLFQRCHATAVVGGGGDTDEHLGHIGWRHAFNAQTVEVGSAQRRGGGVAGRGGQQAVDQVGQRVDLGHGVHRVGGLFAQHLVEQGQAVDVGGHGTQCHANALVVGGGRVAARRGVVAVAVGFGQDAVVRVHQGLHLGCGVDAVGHHSRRRQRAVDGAEVARVDAADARLGELGAGGRVQRAAVVLRVGADRLQGTVVSGSGGADQGLQLGMGVDLTHAGGGHSLLHHGQLDGAHAADAQGVPGAQRQGGVGGVVGGAGQYPLAQAGQGGQFGKGVYRFGGAHANHACQQLGAGGADAVQAQCFKVGLAQVGSGQGVFVGCAQQAVDAVGHRLHLGGAVGGAAVELGHKAVHRGQIAGVDAGHFNG